mmetsp:Transcript_123741/g.346550  ORF Transcript_123741/g.346550 Transcript_123741/m.346550 type:complete len:241 (-) Transcript_123741:42-764(-)
MMKLNTARSFFLMVNSCWFSARVLSYAARWFESVSVTFLCSLSCKAMQFVFSAIFSSVSAISEPRRFKSVETWLKLTRFMFSKALHSTMTSSSSAKESATILFKMLRAFAMDSSVNLGAAEAPECSRDVTSSDNLPLKRRIASSTVILSCTSLMACWMPTFSASNCFATNSASAEFTTCTVACTRLAFAGCATGASSPWRRKCAAAAAPTAEAASTVRSALIFIGLVCGTLVLRWGGGCE